MTDVFHDAVVVPIESIQVRLVAQQYVRLETILVIGIDSGADTYQTQNKSGVKGQFNLQVCQRLTELTKQVKKCKLKNSVLKAAIDNCKKRLD